MPPSALGSIMFISSREDDSDLEEALTFFLNDVLVEGLDLSHKDTFHGINTITRTYMDYVPNSGLRFNSRTYHTKPGTSPYQGILIVQFIVSVPILKEDVHLKYLIRERSLRTYRTSIDENDPENSIKWDSFDESGK